MDDTTKYLSASDTITVVRSGDQPALKIGDTQYQFPSDRNAQHQITGQLRSAWQELQTLVDEKSTVGS